MSINNNSGLRSTLGLPAGGRSSVGGFGGGRQSPRRAGSPSRPFSPGGGRSQMVDRDLINMISGPPPNAGGGRASRQSPYGAYGRSSVYGGRGTMSRAGSVRDASMQGYGGGAMIDNNEAIEMNSPDLIEKERRFERMRLELKRQFEAIDTNGDGFLDKMEIVNYLINLSMQNGAVAGMDEEQQHEMRINFENIVDNVFINLDANNDGKVSLEEFVNAYHTQKRELIEEIELLELTIKDCIVREETIDHKLDELRQTEKSTNQQLPP